MHVLGLETLFLCAFFLLLFLCCFSSLKFHCFAVFAFNVNKDNSFNNVLQCLLLNKPHKKKKKKLCICSIREYEQKEVQQFVSK